MTDAERFYKFKIAELEEKFDTLAKMNEGRENPSIVEKLRTIWIEIVRYRDLLEEA